MICLNFIASFRKKIFLLKTIWYLVFILTNWQLLAQQPAAKVKFEGGNGVEVYSKTPCVSITQRAVIKMKLKTEIQKLKNSGKIAPMPLAKQVLLEWPMQLADGFTDYGYHGVSNFIDHNEVAPNALQDYNCNTRTYDTNSGYNHQGIDYFLWPFDWHKVDVNAVEVIAAAAGIIIGKDDGNFDENCSFVGNWNAVYILHDDGSIVWYGHLKQNSLTNKQVGERVEVGEYLGIIASSGQSTGPHLHFELYDANDNLIDPYVGDCNSTTTTSWWANQRPYYDSGINTLLTHDAPPAFNSCPQRADQNRQNEFCSGDLVYFATYYRDQLNTQTSQYAIYQPNQATWDTWTHSSTVNHYNASYWYWSGNLSTHPMPGTWRFEVIYEGQTYKHDFYVCKTTPVGRVFLKTYLAGAFQDTEMCTDLRDMGALPLTQPYQNSPWGYVGAEQLALASLLPVDVVDWVLVVARNEAFEVIEQKAALLRKDGILINVDGSEGIPFTQLVLNEDYFFSIHHRNHLAVLSSELISLNNTTAPYDFSDPDLVMGGVNQLSALNNGAYGMIAGDIDGNGVINVQDFNQYMNDLQLAQPYSSGNMDLNGILSVDDFNFYQEQASKIGVSGIRY